MIDRNPLSTHQPCSCHGPPTVAVYSSLPAAGVCSKTCTGRSPGSARPAATSAPHAQRWFACVHRRGRPILFHSTTTGGPDRPLRKSVNTGRYERRTGHASLTNRPFQGMETKVCPRAPPASSRCWIVCCITPEVHSPIEGRIAIAYARASQEKTAGRRRRKK